MQRSKCLEKSRRMLVVPLQLTIILQVIRQHFQLEPGAVSCVAMLNIIIKQREARRNV